MTAIILILAAYLLTVIGVEGWRKLAVRRQILDVPNERSSHSHPTPRGGGAVICAVIMIFLVAGGWNYPNFNELLLFLFGAFLIAVISWLDDLYSLPSWLRFAVQTVAAIVVISGSGYFTVLELPFATLKFEIALFGQLLTLLWIVGLTNAYNFMDGIDGIAGMQGLIAGIGWSLAGWLTEMPLITFFGGLLAAASLGFLWHNWHPARIFMGDVGSAFLGFSFAVLPLLAMRQSVSGERWLIFGVLVVWTFVFDAVLTFARRVKNRENVFAAHRSHLYQRLVITGFRHDTVAFIYGCLSLAGICLGILWLKFDAYVIRLLVMLVLSLLAGGLWFGVTIIEKNKKRA